MYFRHFSCIKSIIFTFTTHLQKFLTINAPFTTVFPRPNGNDTFDRSIMQPRAPPRAKSVPVDETDHHEDHCEGCDGFGTLLCCDNCDLAFHFTCSEPPMLPDQVISESDKWYCRKCAYELTRRNNASNFEGPFGSIMELSASLNPHVFSLPTSIRRQSQTEQHKTKDVADLEFADLLKNPELCLARYSAPDVVDSRKRKGVRFPYHALVHISLYHFLPFFTPLEQLSSQALRKTQIW